MKLGYLANSKEFVREINCEMILKNLGHLSEKQISFVAFCISAMTLLGSFNLTAFAVGSLFLFKATALSWMLHHSKIPWSQMLKTCIIIVFKHFGVTEIHVAIDDSDRARSKVIKALWRVFKTIDKRTGGWINAQNLVFLTIVTNKITLPVLFYFYRPDPVYSAWEKKDKKLRKKGVKKKDRPKEPIRNKKYPTRIDIAIKLITRLYTFLGFIKKTEKLNIEVLSVSFDSAFMSPKIRRHIKNIFPKAQCVSQIALSQIVWNKSGNKRSVENHFKNKTPIKTYVNIRGKKVSVEYIGERLFVQSHGTVLHVIAMKYEGESKYRYIVASKLTWRSIDIIRAYALRWLIEVVFFDWKQHDGWGRKAYQQGADGACRGVILSLLVDCFLLLHPLQLRQYRIGQPLCTAGSLVRHIQYEYMIDTIKEIFEDPDPKQALERLVKNIQNVIRIEPSIKHMSGINLGEFGPTPALIKRWG